MSGHSSRREWLLLACTLAACGKSAPAKPEADPAEVGKLAAMMLRDVPTPAAVRDCTESDLDGGMPMTFRTLALLGATTLDDRPEVADWINPVELEAAPVRTLVDSKDEKKKRQAAAELLAAPFWVAYKVDHVNAPMALGIRDPKIGTIATRVIRYEKTGHPACVLLFYFQNDQKVSDDAIAVSDKGAMIDPGVAKVLRDDLTQQYIKLAPRGKAAAAKPATK